MILPHCVQLFMKATLLDQIAQEYEKANETQATYNRMIDTKEKVVQSCYTLETFDEKDYLILTSGNFSREERNQGTGGTVEESSEVERNGRES